MVFIMDYIRTEAGKKGFTRFLEANPPARPEDLPNNSTDARVSTRLKIQQDWDYKNQHYMACVTSITEGTRFYSIVRSHLQKGNPNQAVNAIREVLFKEAGRPPKEIIDIYFQQYKLSDQGSLADDYRYAVEMIEKATEALNSLPEDEGHYELTTTEKAGYLRTILTPLQRFQHIFNSGQVTAKRFTKMCRQLSQAIDVVHTNKAYGELTAAQSKHHHVSNEISSPQGLTAQTNNTDHANYTNSSNPDYAGNQRSWNWKNRKNNNNYRSNNNYGGHSNYNSSNNYNKNNNNKNDSNSNNSNNFNHSPQNYSYRSSSPYRNSSNNYRSNSPGNFRPNSPGSNRPNFQNSQHSRSNSQNSQRSHHSQHSKYSRSNSRNSRSPTPYYLNDRRDRSRSRDKYHHSGSNQHSYPNYGYHSGYSPQAHFAGPYSPPPNYYPPSPIPSPMHANFAGYPQPFSFPPYPISSHSSSSSQPIPSFVAASTSTFSKSSNK
jgi:hypothetical protein